MNCYERPLMIIRCAVRNKAASYRSFFDNYYRTGCGFDDGRNSNCPDREICFKQYEMEMRRLESGGELTEKNCMHD